MNFLARPFLAFALCFVCAMPALASSVLSPGDLVKAHAKEEANCEKCHKKFDKGAQDRLCMDCHKDVGKDIAEKKGYHGRIQPQKPCKECHTEHKGRDFKIVVFDTSKFDHLQTDYPLKGKHAEPKVKCADCHKPGKKYSEAPSICNDCHKKDDKHKGGLGTDCAKCHTEKDWKETSFDHDKTKFKLRFKHQEAKCDKCHIDGRYKNTPMACNSCHQKDDKHKGKFGPKCETCHTDKEWKEIIFDHGRMTKYPLIGKHADLKIKCTDCHKGDLYRDKLKKDCVACHKKDDDKVHKGKFGPKCETCHTEKGWKEILFDHGKLTKFPLLGKHADPKVKCSDCHKGDLYKDKLQTACVSCHKKDDDKVHKGNFGSKCETCHTERDWKEILFDHDKQTQYPLRGKHAEPKIKCTDCHKGDLYKDKLQTDCYACHEKDDKHKGQEGKKCETCHNEQDWKKTSFKHNTMSRFPLLGAHAMVECKKCHFAPTFKDAPSDCWSCHEKDDAKVHKRRFGTECQDCHNTRNWMAWDFDHNKTGFKLDGPHKSLTRVSDCYKCHQRPMGKKVEQSKLCGSCHDKDDIHNGDFGPQCDRCHIGDTWRELKLGITR